MRTRRLLSVADDAGRLRQADRVAVGARRRFLVVGALQAERQVGHVGGVGGTGDLRGDEEVARLAVSLAAERAHRAGVEIVGARRRRRGGNVTLPGEQADEGAIRAGAGQDGGRLAPGQRHDDVVAS